MGQWKDRIPKQEKHLNATVAKVFPDVIAGVVVVSATVAATSWAGNIVNGQDLVALFGMVMGYVFGKNAAGA